MKKGFTLLEILIAAGILTLIGSISLISFVSSRNVRQLAVTGQDILSNLKVAQEKTLAGENNSVWGVRLEQGAFYLFRGSGYATSTLIQSYNLPSALEIVNISLSGGGQEVVFQGVSGHTANTGTFDLRIKGTQQVFQIKIESSGKSYRAMSEGAPPASTRTMDVRHRNFNLGWSLQGASNLILTFYDPPNPNTVQIIPMAAYFNGGQTSFDWSGKINVGGQEQSLRIHTIFLNAASTTLSIDRDCRYNTKKLNITVDVKDIVTYEANCQTLNLGPWGGTVTEP